MSLRCVSVRDQVIRVNVQSDEHVHLLQALESQEEWEVHTHRHAHTHEQKDDKVQFEISHMRVYVG